jgi:hypothetical protein
MIHISKSKSHIYKAQMVTENAQFPADLYELFHQRCAAPLAKPPALAAADSVSVPQAYSGLMAALSMVH